MFISAKYLDLEYSCVLHLNDVHNVLDGVTLKDYTSQVAIIDELQPGHRTPESSISSISSNMSSSEAPRISVGTGPSGTLMNSVVRITSRSVSSRVSGALIPVAFSTHVRPLPIYPGLQAQDHLDQLLKIFC